MLRKVMTGLILGLFLFNGTIMAAEDKKTVQEQKPVTPLQIDRTDYPNLYPCDPCIEGEAVWMVQARLKELGYDIEPNGVYSQSTSKIVKLFQTAHGLKDNGIVTQLVWEALMNGEANEPCIAENNKSKSDRLLIEIDVSKRRLVLYQNDLVVKEYPVAVGKSSTPTPLGEWKIVQKSLNWGNGFGTRWMGLNVPWGIFGIHGTNKPGSIGTFASHGCIRMLNSHVEDLYPRVNEGTTVRIVENGKMFPENLKPVTLKKKASGQRVVYVQSRLKELGLVFDRADGRFGNMTELAVKYYQIWHELEPTGVMDEATYRAMGMIK
ncbi:MAG: peptidoglycan-binding protein [Syntrophomonadaceae bacterium]|nr:peptidoglycan-binding protein [Syntrophomonadaceae bacterium]